MAAGSLWPNDWWGQVKVVHGPVMHVVRNQDCLVLKLPGSGDESTSVSKEPGHSLGGKVIAGLQCPCMFCFKATQNIPLITCANKLQYVKMRMY